MRGDVMRCPLPSGELEPMAQSRLRSAAILGERFCAAVEILQKGPNFEQDFEPLAHTDIPPNQSPRHTTHFHPISYAVPPLPPPPPSAPPTHNSPHSFSFRTAKATIVPRGWGQGNGAAVLAVR